MHFNYKESAGINIMANMAHIFYDLRTEFVSYFSVTVIVIVTVILISAMFTF